MTAIDPRPAPTQLVPLPLLPPSSPELAALLARIADGAVERELHRENPIREVRWLADAGIGAWRLPVAAGGLGLSLRELLAGVIEIARADANVAHILRSHFLVVESRRHLADDPWVAATARGELFGIATAEPTTTRVDSRDYATRLTPTDGGWRLDGAKTYSTGSLFADWVQVVGALPDGTLQPVIVHHDAHGVVHDDDWDGFGQRLTGSGTTRFDGVFVPTEHALGSRPSTPGSTEHLDYRGTFAQLYLQAVIAGIVANAADDIATVVRGRRRTFSHAAAPVAADDPVIQHLAGQVDGLAFTARAAVLVAAESLDLAAASINPAGTIDPDLGHQASLDVARTKAPVEELAARATYLVFEAGGASTTRVGTDLDRHWRNVRTIASHNPTVHKTRAVGQHLVSGTPVPANGFF